MLWSALDEFKLVLDGMGGVEDVFVDVVDVCEVIAAGIDVMTAAAVVAVEVIVVVVVVVVVVVEVALDTLAEPAEDLLTVCKLTVVEFFCDLLDFLLDLE